MLYTIANGPMQTTAAFAKVGTTTSIKTMLQVKTVVPAKVVEWGISFDGTTAATPGEVELIETGSVFATVTASVNADITELDGEALLFGDPTTALISVGTSATGYTASAEGSITAVRNLAGPQQIAGTNQFVQQFPLGREPLLQAAKSLRIRVTFGVAVNAYTYVTLAF